MHALDFNENMCLSLLANTTWLNMRYIYRFRFYKKYERNKGNQIQLDIATEASNEINNMHQTVTVLKVNDEKAIDNSNYYLAQVMPFYLMSLNLVINIPVNSRIE